MIVEKVLVFGQGRRQELISCPSSPVQGGMAMALPYSVAASFCGMLRYRIQIRNRTLSQSRLGDWA